MDTDDMKKPPETEHPEPQEQRFPLSRVLSKRVLNVIGIYRLFVSMMLAGGVYFDFLFVTHKQLEPLISQLALTFFCITSLVFLVYSHLKSINVFILARVSLLSDALFLSILYVAFGGVESGLGILLFFTSANAAILLPLRSALFVASQVTLLVVGEPLIDYLLRQETTANVLTSGIYGLTNFLTAILVHLIAIRARDFRLIAERQELRLTRLEQINELIIKRMRGGVIVVSQTGEIQLMNESAWFLLGSPNATVRELNHVAPELMDSLQQWTKTAKDGEAIVLHESQSQVIPTFVLLPDGGEMKFIIFLESSGVVAQRALQMSTHSLAKLSGGIAHEIRNPLAAVTHAAQLLGETNKLQQEDLRLVHIITKQAKRMNDIVENILQLSRREKSRADLFELAPWIHHFANEFNSTSMAEEVELALDLVDEEIFVIFDRSQLHQTLWKLMENAIDHRGDDVQVLSVTLRLNLDETASHCIITVEDNGPGIPEENINHVFEPFYTTRPTGTGLGLYIARQLCDANNAEIAVDSPPDGPTRFRIRIAIPGPSKQ
jgi:two-component system sensor histidine kinase PilS (NtrC family)